MGSRGRSWGLALGLLCVGALLCAPPAQAQEGDKAALLALKQGLTATGVGNSSFWVRSRWSNNTQPCGGANATLPWKHITCAGKGTARRVVAINLSKAQTGLVTLGGQIAWANMSSMGRLAIFTMAGQDVQGEVPSDEGGPLSLPSLIILNLSSNNLTELADSVTQLQSLQKLDLSGNPLQGSLSANLSTLITLKMLALGNSSLTGSIPEGFSALSRLMSLDMQNCNLTGQIPPISGLANLMELDLGGNALVGGVPEVLPPALERLLLQHNNLTGPFPTQILSLASLRAVNLDSNMLSGPLPAELPSTNLTISLRDNYFNGTLPANAPPALLQGNCLTGVDNAQKPADVCAAFYASPPTVPPAGPAPGPATSPPPPPPTAGPNLGLIIGLSVAGGILILALVGVLIWFLMSKKSSEDEYEDEPSGDQDEEEEEDDDNDRKDDQDDEDDEDDDDDDKHDKDGRK